MCLNVLIMILLQLTWKKYCDTVLSWTCTASSCSETSLLREEHKEIFKISRNYVCHCHSCSGYWEGDLNEKIRSCRINEGEHPMEDQWAKLFWSFLSSVLVNSLRCLFFLAVLLSVTLEQIMLCSSCCTIGFCTTKISTLATALGPLWDASCLLLHWVLTQHLYVSREMCFSVYFGADRNDESSRRSSLGQECIPEGQIFWITEAESISKSCSS